MKKRVLAIAMSLAMTLSLLPVSALAAETGETPEEETQQSISMNELNENDVDITVDDDDVTIIEETQVVVGSSADGATISQAITNGAQEITLGGHVTEDVTIPEGVEVTIDLAGYTLTGHVAVKGNLTIEDSTASSEPSVSEDYGTVTYSSGKITSTGTTVLVSEGGTVILKSGEVESTGNIALFAEGDKTGSVSVLSKVVIEGGYAVGQEGAASAQGKGATVNVNGGVLEALDNAVVAGNGTVNASVNCGGTTINISDGIIIGHIQTKGYIACGVYHPQEGELNITGGTIYADGGVGILMRAGTADISGGKIVGSGSESTEGWVGDSKYKISCAGVVYDEKADYPGMDSKDQITISGNAIVESVGSGVPAVTVLKSDSADVQNEKRMVVSGGQFNTAVAEEYLPSGMTQGEDGKVVVDTSKAVASVNGVGYDDLQEAINAAESKDTVTLLSNTTENVTVAEDDNIILDLNGFTLSGGTDKDSDGNDTVHKDKAAITNNGIITIRDSKGGGVIKRDDVNASADSYYVLLNQGTMIIESGTIYNNSGVNGEGSSLICNLGTNSKEATLTISGGKIQQDNFIAVKNDDYGILNVTGGTIISNEQAIQNWNEAEVTGGTMRGDVITWSYIQVPNNAKMSISGGKIEGNVCSINYYSNNSYGTAPEVTISDNACVMGTLGTYTYNSGVQIPVADDQAKITVNGGDFGNPVSELYLDESLTAELYSTRRNPDAPYSYYKDTSEALENAQPGDNITVVNSETVDTHRVTFNYNYNNGTSNVVAIVADNERITLPTPDNRTGYTFNGWRSSADNDLHKADTSVTITKDTTFTADWTRNQTDRPSGGGSSSSDSGDYLITVDRVSGGRVTVQPGRADKGETVTITVYPNDGYELDELVVTDSRGNEIDLDARSATRFTFTMPGGKVTVEASFVREGGQPQVPQTTFADVPASAWYYNAVEYVYENGLMSGVSGGRFAPDDTLTRAMLVQTLYAMEGRPATASAGFADVASGDWYASAVNWAAANGVVSGVSETGFGPNNALTREQLALILYRFAQYKGYDVTGTSDLTAYADGSSVSGWAAEAMSWAVDAGLISGVGGNQIAPTGTASRAQVAQILMNFCENVAR